MTPPAAAAAQAYAIARANHTGTQTASTISDFDTQVATTAILKSLVDAKGDTLVGTADNTITRLRSGRTARCRRLTDADDRHPLGLLGPGPRRPEERQHHLLLHAGVLDDRRDDQRPRRQLLLLLPVLVATPITVDQLAIEQTDAAAAGKLMRFGIIAADKWWQPTGSALADSGNIAADGANGAKTYTPARRSLSGRYLGVIHPTAPRRCGRGSAPAR